MRKNSRASYFLSFHPLIFALAGVDFASGGVLYEGNLSDAPLPPLAEVKVNNEEQKMMIDTGASVTLFADWGRSKLGPAIGTLPTSSSTGTTSMTYHKAPTISWGNLAYKDESVGLMANLDIGKVLGLPVIGIVGMNTLHGRLVRFDFENGKLEVLDNRGIEEGYATVAIGYVKSVPYLMQELGGSRVKLTIDTGMNDAIRVTQKTYQQLIKENLVEGVSPAVVASAGGMQPAQRGLLKSLVFLGKPYYNLKMVVGGDADAVGMGLLVHYNLLFDFVKDELLYKDRKVAPCLNVPAMLGFAINYIGQRCQIVAIKPHGPAEKAGLAPGDLIVTLGNLEESKLNAYSIYFEVAKSSGTSILLRTKKSESGVARKVMLTMPEPIRLHEQLGP
jgi:hypothetical protein